MVKHVASEAFLEALNAHGVEFIFFNPGIDTVPLLETISKFRASARQTPSGILCLDESVAMTAALGNYMVSGRPQVVLVHSELGTQQVGGALHNAQWGRVPVILCAEPLGPAERVNWRQESFDQGSMVRNCVTWDHQLSENEDMSDVIHQALRIATAEPCGPVYLALPRDAYHKEVDTVTNRAAAGVGATPTPKADVTVLGKAAEIVMNARDPLIIAGYTGRHPQSVVSLVELAETLCARVLSTDIRMNFPNTHPLSACLDPSAVSRRLNPYLTTADVILVIDYDIPYAPPPSVPRGDAKVVHIDIDPKKRGEPLWDRQPDILIEADSSQAIPALNEIIRQRLTPEERARFHERFERLESEHKRLRNKWHDLAMREADRKPISSDWLCRCIDEVITDDTIIVNQTITPSASVAHQIRRTKPGTLLSCSGGSIGWALGAGLGVKLASPDRTVVSLMGDGAFIYGCPVATLWSANFYHAPFLSIIFNNQAYGAIKGLFKEIYTVDNMGADITAPPDYALVAQACNAYGRMVEDPSDVLPALRDAMDHVHNGSSAVLDVKLKQP